MQIKVHLDRLLADRKMSIAELGDRIGISVANLRILKQGEARAIRMTTLQAICRELRCQPGDLLSADADVGDSDLRDSGQS